MKFILFAFVLFFSCTVFGQSYDPIYGKKNFKDSLKTRYKNNAALDSVLTTDTLGRVFLKKVTGGGGTVTNYDSLKRLFVDTSLRRNGYLLAFDSINHKWYLASGGVAGGGGTVTNVATGYGITGGSITATGTLIADTTSAGGLVSKSNLSNNLALKVNISDTSNMLTAYRAGINTNAAAIQQRTDSLRNNAGVLEARKGGVFVPQFTLPTAGGGGTVTNVATGLGLLGGAITTTGTLIVDTSSASILSRQRAAATYQPTISLTTTGSSGASTLVGSTLNIPIPKTINYDSSYVDFTTTLDSTTVIFRKVNGGKDTIVFVGSGTGGGSTPITLTTTGTSGASTLTGSALNIPNYAGGGSGTGIVKGYLPLVLRNDSVFQRFNVLTYGAIPNDTLDDSYAIQAAINAAYAAGGGTVFFPNGKYYLKNPLVNTGAAPIGSPNSQLYIKYEPSYLTASGAISIKLMGETAPSANASALGNYTINNTGVILYSTITGSGAFPSIFGSDGYAAVPSINIAAISIENINFRVKANIGAVGPTMSAANLSLINFVTLNNVLCDLDTSTNVSVYPTAETFGVYMPKINNGAWVSINNTLVTGFKYGYIMDEHSTGNNINAFVCEHAFVFSNTYHAASFSRLGAYWCKYSISGPVGTIPQGTSNSYFDIKQLDVEFQIALGNWFDRRYIIYDSTNVLKSRINYHMVKRNVGVDNTGFNKLGGTFVYADPLATGQITASQTISPYVIGSQISGGNLNLISNQFANGKINFGSLGNSVYDEANNRFGIGIATPASRLHLKGTGGTAGGLTIETTNPIDYGAINFNNQSGAVAGQFLQTNSGFTSGVFIPKQTALFNFEVGGQVLLGAGDAAGNIAFATGGYATGNIRQQISSAGLIRFNAYGAGTLTTDASGNITATSDERLKTNIIPYKTGLKELMKLNPITYSWNKKSGNETKGTYAGFSAQNVKASIPYGTGEMKDGYLTLQDRAIMATMTNSIKELYEIILKLKSELVELKKKVN